MPATPEFEIDVGHGRATLLLRPSTFFGWLQADSLALAVPEVQFPLDIRAGMGQFQRQRCQLTSASLSIDENGLTAFTAGRAPLLLRVGFDNVEVRLMEGTAGVVGTARLGGHVAELTFSVYAEPEGRNIRLWLAEPSLFGHLPRPAPIVAHDLTCVLLGAVTADDPLNEEIDRPVAVGLGQFLVPPLDLIASRVLAPAGWRLPDASRVHIAEAMIAGGRVELRYAAANVEVGALFETPAAGASTRDAHDRFRTWDDMLLRGQLDGAAAGYRGDLVRHPDHAEFLSQRLLAVLSARRSTLRDAALFARQVLERAPGSIATHLALAGISLAQEKPELAIDEFVRVSDLAEATGDDDRAVCAAACAARLLRERDTVRAGDLYARVAARRPGHAEAVQALADVYRQGRRWAELAELLEQRAPLTRDRAARARLHLELAAIHTEHIVDLARARRELEHATSAQPDNVLAWDALVFTLSQLGEIPQAIAAAERLCALFVARRDPIGEGRAWARIGELWQRAGDPRRAHHMLARALALVPSEPNVLERAAAVAVQLGLLDEAADAYQLLAESPVATADQQQRAIRELLTIHVRRGDLDRIRFCLDLAPDAADPEMRVAIATLEEAGGHLDRAVARLGEAAAGMSGARACEIETDVARLSQALGRNADARRALERAYAADPGSALATAAARRLSEDARAAGDVTREVRWLDAFLEHQLPGPTLDGGLQVRRAYLAFAAGDPATARPLLERVHRPGIAGAERLYAEVVGALGDAAGKARVLEALAEAAPSPRERAELMAGAAMALVDAGDARTAMARARAALELDPDGEAAQRAVADTVWHARAWDELVAIYPGWLEVATGPDRVVAAYRLGAGLERVGQLREAFACYRTAIESAETGSALLPDCWRRLASLCEQLGDYRDAADAYSTAAADPRVDQTVERRAELLARAAEIRVRFLGRADAAVAEAERALALDPGNAPALAILESIAAETGDPALARWMKPPAPVVGLPAVPPGADAEDAACVAEAQQILTVLRDVGDAEAAMTAWAAARELWPESKLLAEVKREIAREFEQAAHLSSTEVPVVAESPVYTPELRAAVDELQRARRDRPYEAAVLRPLIDLTVRARDWPAAIKAMTDLLAGAGDTGARVDLIYRIGEIYRVHLADTEKAGEHYLKALDLDPRHGPTLRRALEYYWQRAELAELGEIGDELGNHVLAELAEGEPSLIVCLGLTAALLGDAARAGELVARLGAGADDAVAHAVASGAASLPAGDLAAALRAVCVGSGMSLSGVRRRLFAYGLSSPRCRTVARMLCD